MSGAPAPAPRSWLFVPGDSERKQARALTTAADALILDLEDSVDPAQLPAARARIRALLRAHAAGQGPQLWVRINAPQTALWREDLAAVVGERAPEGIVLPKISSPPGRLHSSSSRPRRRGDCWRCRNTHRLSMPRPRRRRASPDSPGVPRT